MGAVKMVTLAEGVDWEYDDEADVLYLSFGKPRKALGIDVGDGIIVRFDKKRQEIVGLTLTGMRGRLLSSLRESRRVTAGDGGRARKTHVLGTAKSANVRRSRATGKSVATARKRTRT